MSENNLRKKAKALTARIHKYVENLPIMKEIMSSELNPERYLKYLIQIRAIYNAIESIIDNENLLIKMSKKCTEYFDKKKGAVKIILNDLK